MTGSIALAEWSEGGGIVVWGWACWGWWLEGVLCSSTCGHVGTVLVCAMAMVRIDETTSRCEVAGVRYFVEYLGVSHRGVPAIARRVAL